MSGLTDKTAQATSIFGTSIAKLTSDLVTAPPELQPRIQSVITSLSSNSTSITGTAANVTANVDGLFNPVQAAATIGLNSILECICKGAADDLTSTFMNGLGDVNEGAGVDKVIESAQDTLDYVNSVDTWTANAVSSLETTVNNAISNSSSIFSDIGGVSSDATSITDVGRSAAQGFGTIAAVKNSCAPSTTFGLPNVKLMFGGLGLALDLALEFENPLDAMCGWLVQSGVADTAIGLQNSMEDKLARLRS